MLELISESLPFARDIGFLAFGLTGAFFSYRSWKQRSEEIKEKYYDRRYELYCLVDQAVQASKNPNASKKFEWWPLYQEAKRRAGFLIDGAALKSIEALHSHAIDYIDALESEMSEERLISLKESRKSIDTEFVNFREAMKRYLYVG